MKRGTSGYSLIETLIVTGIVVLVMAGFAQVLSSFFRQEKASSLSTRKQDIIVTTMNLINNNEAWQRTIDRATNTALNCLKDPGKFPAVPNAGSCTMADTGQFSLLDAAGNVYIDMTATAGFSASSGPCNTYSAAGDDSCPLRAELTWRPLCVTCARDQVEVTLTIRETTPTAGTRSITTRRFVRYAQTGDFDLVLHYKFDGALNANILTGSAIIDSSGYGHDGVMAEGAGAAAVLQYVAGKKGTAIRFISTNNRYVETNATAELRPNDITVAAWVNRDASAVEGGIVDLHRTNIYDSYVLRIELDTTFCFCVAEFGIPRCAIANIGGVTVGQWYHVVGTWDGNIIKVYVDGVLRATAVYNGPNYFGAAPLRIGVENQDGNFKTFPGVLDDIKIWRRALTAAEIMKEFSTP